MTRTAPRPQLGARILWLLRAFGRLPDSRLEALLPDLPGSTVRGVRCRLWRSGAILEAGRTADGKRKLWRAAK